MQQLAALQSGLVALSLWFAAAAAAAAAGQGLRCPDIFQETPRPAAPPLSPERLTQLGNLTRPRRLRELAGPLLAGPRTVGSAGHAAAAGHLAGFLRRLGWRVSQDRFAAETPLGRRRFANLIATRPPDTSDTSDSPDGVDTPRSVLVLAAHYDSAPLSADGFVGATDSAVPCAILLMLAEALDALVVTRRAVAVRIVFFDGEEALGGEWTPEDSLYGSRHLAGRWLLEGGVNPDCPAVAEVSDLVLLDLIGAARPRLVYGRAPGGPVSLAAKERRDFGRLAATEARLRAAGHLSEAADCVRPIFSVGSRGDADTVDDDHVPFRRLGVPALHLVPRPFPAVWHTSADNASAVHWGHSAAVARVLLAWLVETIEGGRQ